ncbi:hypothetical protein ACFWE5_00890 [Cellulosimicrobium funkei]|uniref:hypothetical protein n=1 Tax=Cellulosimicrobium funkei TaxID=264251 RepID=UPI00364861A5
MGWIDDYKSHALWGMLDEVRSVLEHYSSPEFFDVDDPRPEMLRALLARLKGMQDAPDITITQRSLGAMSELLTELLSYLPDLNPIFAPFRRSEPLFDDIARLLGSWPQPGSARLTGLGSQLSNLDGMLKEFRGQIAVSEEAIAEARVRSDEYARQQRTEADRLVREVESRIAEVDRAVTSLQAAAETQKGRIDDAINRFQGEFNVAETERRQEWENQLSDQEAMAKEHLVRMGEREERSRKVLEAVGVNSTATSFGQYALEQSEAADRWRAVASWVFIAAGVWFIASSLPWLLPNGADLWESALARLGVTAAVAGVGAYAARESSQHRREERKAKQVQLVLTALEPFIANLPEEQQNSVRLASAQAIFVLRAEADSVDGASADAPTQALEAVLAKLIAAPKRT